MAGRCPELASMDEGHLLQSPALAQLAVSALRTLLDARLRSCEVTVLPCWGCGPELSSRLCVVARSSVVFQYKIIGFASLVSNKANFIFENNM